MSTLSSHHHYNTIVGARHRMEEQEQELERVSSELEDLPGSVGQVMEMMQVIRAKMYI